MANGMGSLYVGVTGLQSSQNAINTTAHNISNVNTTGYTRQQVVFGDIGYTDIGNNATKVLQSGLGVNIETVRRCRDEFLDAAYRQENGRKGFYESQYEAVTEVETQFGEMQGVKFQEIIDNVRSSMNELALNPTSNVARAALVQSSVAFVDRANEIYNSLRKYQNTLNTKVQSMVDQVNELGNTIYKLNSQILKTETNGEHANDLRDQRDDALDKLGALVKINCNEQPNGSIEVYVEGVPFISSNSLLTMSTEVIEGTDLVNPVWEMYDKDVFALDVEINTAKNNDIGELKGWLLARGDGLADYKAYDDAQYYEQNVKPSVIKTAMAGLDKLVHDMVTDINDVLCPDETTERTVETAAGPVTGIFLDMEKTAYGMDDNKSVGTELFARDFTDRYVKVQGLDGNTYYMRNDKNVFGNTSEYKLGNISVNTEVLANYGKIPLTNKNGEESFDKAEQLLDLWKKEDMTGNPITGAKESYSSFYNSFIYDMGINGEVMNNMAESQNSMSLSLDSRRNEVAGVSSDEELTNMIKFQNAYNASSRYITVVSEMIEHLIERLGA